MRFTDIISQFKKGINWNALFFIWHKLLFIAMTIALFYTLNQNDFSVWTGINSTIFLVLLWLDMGLRKAIPRFAPLFEQNPTRQQWFITGLILLQVMLLLLATPLLYYSAHHLAPRLSTAPIPWITLGTGIFIIEGCNAILRLLYHAHFWVKEFNSKAILVITVEIIINCSMLGILPTSSARLQALFYTRIATGCFLTCWLLYTLKYQIKKRQSSFPAYTNISTKTLIKQFTQHSLIMGFYTNLKSLSERNFLHPFFMYTLGPLQASFFKIANDVALFFYRIVVKTIGITDTTLLSHVETTHENKMTRTFSILLHKILWLCAPVFIIFIILIVPLNTYIFSHTIQTKAFFIMTMGYLLEAAVSPFERLLEVKRCYRLLTTIYMPYIITLIYFFYAAHTTGISLINALIMLHSARLISSFGSVALASAILYKKEKQRSACKNGYRRTAGACLPLLGKK